MEVVRHLPTEVLEAILSHLDQVDLLLSQRVSRTWRDVIGASPNLQQKLFFQPITSQTASKLTAFLRNPLLEPGATQCVSIMKRELTRPAMWEVAFYDPLRRRPVLLCCWWYLGQEQTVCLGAVTKRDTSWRRMLPVQPPVRVATITQTCQCYCDGLGVPRRWRYRATLSGHVQEKGISMGQLWDLLVYLQEKGGINSSVRLAEWHLPSTAGDFGDQLGTVNIDWYCYEKCFVDRHPQQATGDVGFPFDGSLLHWVAVEDEKNEACPNRTHFWNR